jgi:beta-glucanase (GH16 family)
MVKLLSSGAPVILLLSALLCQQSAAQTQPGWTLVWSEEFSQPDGSPPGSRTWAFDTGGGGWGNSELQTYTTRTNNCRIENGMLVIEAKKENYTGNDGISRNYTSARIKTQGKWSWTYGRVEGRLKIPRGKGIWPAFWMLGTNITSVGWPTCGEIDIMENIGSEPLKVHGTIHGPGYSGGNSVGGPCTLPDGAEFADDFHVYAIEWETNRIRWYVDDQLYFTATPRNLPPGSEWVFTQPEFLILNVAVGGKWPGSPDASTTFPQRMTVDYIRVYAATNMEACGGNALTTPGFESAGFGDWAAYGAGFNTALANSFVRTGSNSFKVFGQFDGNENYSGLYQDRSCAPGSSFTADGWLFTPSNDRIAGQNKAWLEVSFRDGSGNMLALYRSDEVGAGTVPDTWLNLPVTNTVDIATYAVTGHASALVAPQGTSFARAQIVFKQTANSTGAVYVDDCSLVAPGPTEFPRQVTSRVSGTDLQLSFSSILAANYQVQYKQWLSGEPWMAATNLAGNGTLLTVSMPIGDGHRFFRVVRLCN